MPQFYPSNTTGKLSDEQRISALKIAEQKLTGAGNTDVLKSVTEQLAESYSRIGSWKQAARYLGMLNRDAQSPEEKEAILPNLLDAFLRWPNIPMAAELVNNCLQIKDLDPNDGVVRKIDQYFSEPPAGVDPNTVLVGFFAQVKTPVDKPRPVWQGLVDRWAARLGRRTSQPRKSKSAGS
jgi:hypothetical protein